ncbi:hypothetical protein NSTC745_00925 [Nostoc sp. DSM 114161]|jgi:hypothetical protein
MMKQKIYLPGDKVPVAGTYEIVNSSGQPLPLPNSFTIKGFLSFPDIQSPMGYGYRLMENFER